MRDKTFDVSRSLCILYIVGYYHLENYVWDEFFMQYFWDSKHLKYITICVLSTFTFLSGYFLKKYKINAKSDILFFYKRRLQRFWIPFFLSALTLHIASLVIHHPWFSSHWHFISTVLGLSIFTPPSPGTIWYISMLMTFYMITPLFLVIKRVGYRILISIVLIVVMAISINLWDLNIRTIYYLPVYLGALITPSGWVMKIKDNSLLSLIFSVFMLFHAIFFISVKWYTIFMSLIFGPIGIIALSTILARSTVVCRISGIVSYSSMNMYLFHRHIFMTFVAIFALCGIGSFSHMKTSVWLLYFIVFPIVVVFSYYSQKFYDNFCRYMDWKSNRK